MTSAITLAADRLDSASRHGVPVAPVRDLLGSTDVARAYAVQNAVNDRRADRGARVVGRKIGLTSTAVQRQLGVDQPDFGVLFDDMAYASGDHVPIGRLIQPKIEAEIAFILDRDLDGELHLDIVRAAVAHVVAALEIVDSRVADWDITIVDTVADNGSSGLYVLGGDPRTLAEIEPRDVTMSMSINDVVASEGAGTACLGDPLEALLWLALTAQRYGEPLRAGQIILSGALGPMAPVAAGDRVVADITGFSPVSINFSQEDA